MRLTAILADMEMVRQDAVHTGHSMGPVRRTVQIELTPEQTAVLCPRKVGTNVYEEYDLVFLEFDEAEKEKEE